MMDINERYALLLSTTNEVRKKQKTYFAMRKSSNVNWPKALDESKESEKKLDKLLDVLNKYNDNQASLFDANT